MKDSRSENIFFVSAIILIVIFLFANTGFRNLVGHYREIAKLKRERSELEKKNVKLRHEIYLLEHESSYIENIARRELGLVSKDEVEYRFKK